MNRPPLKMLSVTMLMPPAVDSTVVIWGCISVGKPGWGRVFTLHLRNCRSQNTRTLSSPSSTVTPISTSLAEMDSKCLGVTFFTVMSPWVAAAAII